jgi:predicted MPP superfamily phosphohydrolase
LKRLKSKSWRRYLKGASLGSLGFCTGWAIDNQHTVAPQWIEILETDLYLRNLSDSFRGLRIVHASDLHCGRTVSARYLKNCIDRINLLDSDIVVLTGDYVTHDIRGRFTKRVINLIGQIKSKYGVYACLGNHDYGVGSLLGSRRDDLLKDLIDGMQNHGVTVLRNESAKLQINGKSLWFVGLGDLWVRDFNPQKAFMAIPADQAIITLSHNPDTAMHLHSFPVDVIMSGHTHGAQTRFAPAPKWKLKKRNFHAGMYKIGEKTLYVNRGLGRLGQLLYNSRPEITVFTLQ